MVLKLAEGVSPRPPSKHSRLGRFSGRAGFWRNAQLPGGLSSVHPGGECRVLGFHSASTGRKFLWSGLICKSLFSCLTAVFLLTLKRILVSLGDSRNEEMGLHLGAVLHTETLLFIAVEWEPVRAVLLAWEAVGAEVPSCGWGGVDSHRFVPCPGHTLCLEASSLCLSVCLPLLLSVSFPPSCSPGSPSLWLNVCELRALLLAPPSKNG